MSSDDKYMASLSDLKKNELPSTRESVAVNSFSHASPLMFTGGKAFKYKSTMESAFHCFKTYAEFQQAGEVIDATAASVKQNLEDEVATEFHGSNNLASLCKKSIGQSALCLTNLIAYINTTYVKLIVQGNPAEPAWAMTTKLSYQFCIAVTQKRNPVCHGFKTK